MTHRSYILATVLFLFGLFAYGQTLSDSVNWQFEMEDSVSGISILPIKEPEELLDSIIRQVIHDYEQESKLYKYKQDWTCYALTTREPLIVKTIISAYSGLTIKSFGKRDSIYIRGLPYLTKDLYGQIEFVLEYRLNSNRIIKFVKQLSYEKKISLYDAFKSLMRAYRIKVYSITDETGRGVYRVNFACKRLRHIIPLCKYDNSRFAGDAYFDYNTLRLTQVKAEVVSTRSAPRWQYQIDFGEEDGKLFVKRFQQKGIKDKKIITRCNIRRLMQ